MAEFIYKREFYRNYFVRNEIKDRHICGCSLVKYVPSLYRETLGATGSESTCYWVLDKIFKDMTLDEKDAFLDVGCGKGRVLAYMIHKSYPCSLTGIELNRDVAAFAQNWAKQYDRLTIIHGNALEQDYNPFTVLSLARPFEPDAFYQFVNHLESNLKHKIRMVFWWDTESGGYLENRTGWNLIKRERVFNSHGLFMYRWPVRYSIWEYTP